jgi:hypothetical protein
VGPAQLLESLGGVQLGSGAGLMEHARSFWTFVATGDAGAVLEDVRTKLAADGWRAPAVDSADSDYPHLRAFRDNEIIEVWRPRPQPPAVPRRQPEPDKADSIAFVVVWRDRFDTDDVRAALEPLFAEPDALETLLIFEDFFDAEQRRRLVALLETSPLRTPQQLLTLARYYHGENDEERAVAALDKAVALLRTLEDPVAPRKAVNQQGKELGHDRFAERPVTPQTMAALGFIELLPDGTAREHEAGADEPAVFFATGADGEVCVFTYRIRRGKGGAPSLHHLMSTGSSRSWGTQGGGTRDDGRWSAERHQSLNNWHARVYAEEASDGRFLFTVSLRPE